MRSNNELTYKMLRNECNANSLKFNDTSEIEPFEGIIGQDRAVKAMEFGLKINIRGYNLYLAGRTGTGKTSYAEKYIRKVAAERKSPDDWCYVYNFDNPSQPTAINLPAGCAKTFQNDMDELIKTLGLKISSAFNGEDYQRGKADIIKKYQKKRNEFLEELNENAEKQGFKVKTTNTGIYFLPIIDGRTINEQEFGELDEKTRHEINEKSNTLQIETIDIVQKIKNVEKEAEQDIAEWENQIALIAVSTGISNLKDKYKDYKKITNYLEKVQKDILDNLQVFKQDDDDSQQQRILFLFKRSAESHLHKYKVNIIVDNSKLNGAPVIVDYNPTYYNLLGKLEYENELGTVVTDFTMIKPGLLHLANGGYLILQARDVLSNIQSWEAVKRVLKTKKLAIENIKEQLGLVNYSTLKPEPIPVDIKIILVGSEYLYQLLYNYDEDFAKLFKIKVDFDDEMERTEENIFKLAQFIGSFCKREAIPHFDRSGVAKVVEYSSRLAEDQRKLTTRFNEIVEILSEASTWAIIEGSSLVCGNHVNKAIKEKNNRSNKYDKKLLKLIEDGTLMVDTEGYVVGQINGLSILDMGDYSFGKPSKITATTFIGESGIVNIEREVEMSGTTHTKGVLILSGYIGQKYAQEIPLSLSASLCFEQLYSGVDGDSASSAELYAILSSLADAPINQGIAVTGSVNQKGEIQPIGGATRKIEGFFELCKLRGLTGEQGVLIPYQNIKNLMLNDEVVEAVKEGKFHIYPVKTIDEGIQILTGIKCGTRRKNGTYARGTINYRVYEKLKKFAQTVSSFGKLEQ
jgi:lon-related putative ATP-dependent protease